MIEFYVYIYGVLIFCRDNVREGIDNWWGDGMGVGFGMEKFWVDFFLW